MSVERLTRKHKPEVVAVLISAFHNYPVMRFILGSGQQYEIQLQAIMEFYCEARLAKNRPVLGVRLNNSLVGVALVDETSLKLWAEIETELIRLKQIIGDEAYSRFELYESKVGRAGPVAPHHFLGMIAVRPEQQGKGYSRMLLDEVKQLSIVDSQSTGVCLNTGDPENVSFYEHFGYKVIAETDIQELHSWCMFLPTRGKKAEFR